MAEINFAGIGQPHGSPGAVQQLRAQRFLEGMFNLLRQGRLRDVQRLGGARKTAVLRDREEIAEERGKMTFLSIGESYGINNDNVLDQVLDPLYIPIADLDWSKD